MRFSAALASWLLLAAGTPIEAQLARPRDPAAVFRVPGEQTLRAAWQSPTRADSLLRSATGIAPRTEATQRSSRAWRGGVVGAALGAAIGGVYGHHLDERSPQQGPTFSPNGHLYSGLLIGAALGGAIGAVVGALSTPGSS